MADPLINIGNIANDGTGDELRVAFRKINQKFNEVDFRIGDTFEVVNSGSGVGLFVERVADGDDDPSNDDVIFKSLVAGKNISITPNQDPADQSVVISSPNTLTDTPFITDSGTYTLTAGDDIKILGGAGINTIVNSTDNSIVIENTRLSEIVEDNTPTLGGNLNADGNSISNVNTITATDFIGGTFRGKLIGTVEDAKTSDINNLFTKFDLGNFSTTITSFYQYLIRTVNVDFGTIINPSSEDVDFGAIN